ncbi:hypothetical protein K9M41_03745 [Candidatus Gracilibacteria bacterium]|nr:hypothetical protein [Candidatus Gracilibacteria bacterium]
MKKSFSDPFYKIIIAIIISSFILFCNSVLVYTFTKTNLKTSLFYPQNISSLISFAKEFSEIDSSSTTKSTSSLDSSYKTTNSTSSTTTKTEDKKDVVVPKENIDLESLEDMTNANNNINPVVNNPIRDDEDPNKADLVITSVGIELGGNVVNLEYCVQNIGDVTARNFYVYLNNLNNQNVNLSGMGFKTLEAGEEFCKNESTYIDNNNNIYIEGENTIRVSADFYNDVDEYDEGNNELTGSIVIGEIRGIRPTLRFSDAGQNEILSNNQDFSEIGRFQLWNMSPGNDEEFLFRGEMRFRNIGNAGLANLENIQLVTYKNLVYERVAEISVENNLVTFAFNQFSLDNRDRTLYSIRADVNEGLDGDVIQLQLVESLFVNAINGRANPVLTMDINGEELSEEDYLLSEYRIFNNEEAIMMKRYYESIGDSEYTPGSTSVIGLEALVQVEQPVSISGVKISVNEDSGIGENSLEDFNNSFGPFHLFLNNSLIDTKENLEIREGGQDGVPTDYEIYFDSEFEINGDGLLKVVFDISEEAEDLGHIKMETAANNLLNPLLQNNRMPVTPDMLRGEAVGSLVTVRTSIVDIKRIDGIEDGTKIVAGIDDFTFMDLLLRNNDLGDVLFTEFEFQAQGRDNAADVGNFTSAIFIDGQQQGNAKVFQNDGPTIFNDIAIVIGSGEREQLNIVMDTMEISGPGIIEMKLTSAEGYNVQDNSPVKVLNKDNVLSVDNPVNGPKLILVSSGILTVERGELIEGGRLIENEENVKILEIRLSAEYDNIQVANIYLENDLNNDGVPDRNRVGERVVFGLYDENDNLIRSRMMFDGILRFELPLRERIFVPEGGSTVVTIKVNVNRIQRDEHVGIPLRLALDSDGLQNEYFGIRAITSTTGNDIPTPANGWGDAVSEIFITSRAE